MPRVVRQTRRETRALLVDERLRELFPGTAAQLCSLSRTNVFELLIATILSAQCTDERVNLVTPKLFERYPTPVELARAKTEDLEALIRSTGFYHVKAKNLKNMATQLLEGHDGMVPLDRDELVRLSGVGRKTANVVLSVAYGIPGLPVDTHVGRLARRLELSSSDDPVRIEADLCALFPETSWGAFSIRLILHGRATCLARRPRCASCILADICPSANRFDS